MVIAHVSLPNFCFYIKLIMLYALMVTPLEYVHNLIGTRCNWNEYKDFKWKLKPFGEHLMCNFFFFSLMTTMENLESNYLLRSRFNLLSNSITLLFQR